MSKKGGAGGGSKRPAIFDAIETEELAAVQPLLSGDLEARNKDGFTPLIFAAYVGSVDIVEALLAAGANPRAACKDSDTALHYAAAQGHLEVVARLGRLKAVNLEATDNDGETPSDVAASAKCKKLLQKLIEERAEGGEEEEEEEEAEEGAEEEA